MELIYALRYFPKLSERFILDEIVQLLKKGIKISIFSLGHPRKSYIHKDVFESGILNEVTYFNGRSLGEQLKGFVSSLDLLKSFLMLEELKIFHVRKAIYFKQVLKSLRPKPYLIHAHFCDDAATLAMHLSSATKIPFTFTAHAYGIFQQSKVEPLLFKEKLRRASGIVAISKYNKIYLQNYSKKPEKIRIIHCGVNLDRFAPKPQKTDELFTILTLGRLVEKKGIDDLIRAVKLVVKEIPAVQIKIVGTGPLETQLRNLVKESRLENHVKFLGNVTNQKLLDLYNRSDIFALPCKIARNGDMDGIPVTLMEAMAMKLPVISTTVSGIPELIEDGSSGILVPPNDFKNLADALKFLIRNPKIREKMGQEGRKIIEDEFNIRKTSVQLLDFFESVIKS